MWAKDLSCYFFKTSYSYDCQACLSSLFCSSSLLELNCCCKSVIARFCLSRRIQTIQRAFEVNSRWHFCRHNVHYDLLSILWVYEMDGKQQMRNSTSGCPPYSLTGFCCENYWPNLNYWPISIRDFSTAHAEDMLKGQRRFLESIL